MPAALAPMQIAPYYWFDGAIRANTDVNVHPFAHALHYGSGVFEGIRAYATPSGAAIFRLHDHMARLLTSAQTYSLEVAYSAEQLCDAVVQGMQRNDLESAYIRPLVFFGEKTISLAPCFHCPTHVLIAYRALGGYFGAGQAAGIRLTLSPWRKFSSMAMPATVKATGHYANSVLAMQDAVARGFDEALLLNDRGQVAEGTGENVFFVRNGVVHTNDSAADVLHGITRATVIELCHERNIPLEIGPISLDDVLGADEVFVTGTAAEVTPVRCLDEREFATARPVTDRLREAYATAVSGADPAHRDWITLVPLENALSASA